MNNKFNIIIDADIPYIEGVLEPYCNVKYLRGEFIGRAQTKDADALIIRTRTKCDLDLLANSRVKAIFTATIGCDHIDTDYCNSAGIRVYNAAGCNSGGVVQYVITSLFAVAKKDKLKAIPKSIGIIGAGSVGERLAALALDLGFSVMRCDPPKKENLIRGGLNPTFGDYRLTADDYYDLDSVLRSCTVVSVHVPYDKTTSSMCSQEFFSKMVKGTIFINSSRGEVVDDKALINNRKSLGSVILDVWRDEPNIDKEVLNISSIATPHIAGYSLEGKINATLFTLRNFAQHFSIAKLSEFSIPLPPSPDVSFIINKDLNTIDNAASLLLCSFPIWNEDSSLRSNPYLFEQLRLNYRYRRELTESTRDILKQILTNS